MVERVSEGFLGHKANQRSGPLSSDLFVRLNSYKAFYTNGGSQRLPGPGVAPAS